MNEALLTDEVRSFLLSHLSVKPAEMALRKSPFPDIMPAELAVQLDGLQRSLKKLPLWHQAHRIVFPPLLALEQSSSAETAAYKSSLIPAGARVADLTGGLGVDTYYFSRVADEVVHCEINPELSQIAEHNFRVLGAHNIICLNTDGVSWLAATDRHVDLVYADPSRRVKQQKVFTLADCQPDISASQELLLEKGAAVMIKAAPLLDITAALRQLRHVSSVHVLSIKNECKELLFILEPDYAGDTSIHCILLPERQKRPFIFTYAEETNAQAAIAAPAGYLYEADAALLKAGCFKLPAVRFGLRKLHQHTHLYTSEVFKADFPGRIFRITKTEGYASFKKRKERIKANVATRNFPLKAEELRKLHKIIDGGEVYLFFCTNHLGSLLVIFSEKVH